MTGRELLELEGNGFVAFAPDGLRIATCSRGNNVTIWDGLTGDEMVVLTGHTDWVQCGALSPDRQRIATASGDPKGDSNGDRRLKIWDTSTGRELLSIKRYRPENDNSSCVAFSPDGSRVAFAGNDLVPTVWDARTGRELLVWRGHIGMVTGVAFSPDGRRIVTASGKVWDALTGWELLSLEGRHTRQVRSAMFSPDGNSIFTAGGDGLIKVWEAASPAQVRTWQREEY